MSQAEDEQQRQQREQLQKMQEQLQQLEERQLRAEQEQKKAQKVPSPVTPAAARRPNQDLRAGHISPDGRFVRKELIGRGSFKSVYRAFDEELSMEVAWNEAAMELRQVSQSTSVRSEIEMLKSMRHPNIISVLDSWEDGSRLKIVFISELLSSGSLTQYMKEAPQRKVNAKTIRRWGAQILFGLDYLHKSNVIHRDLKCSNIFVNGHRGEVKIGDLGLSVIHRDSGVNSVIGTPEFMAPEIYDERYTYSVDVYAFGMCLLQMSTGSYPYQECENVGQVFKRVTANIPPKCLDEVEDNEVGELIRKCIRPAGRGRPQIAAEVLAEPFFCIRASPSRAEPAARARAAASCPPTASSGASCPPSPRSSACSGRPRRGLVKGELAKELACRFWGSDGSYSGPGADSGGKRGAPQRREPQRGLFAEPHLPTVSCPTAGTVPALASKQHKQHPGWGQRSVPVLPAQRASHAPPPPRTPPCRACRSASSSVQPLVSTRGSRGEPPPVLSAHAAAPAPGSGTGPGSTPAVGGGGAPQGGQGRRATASRS
eukprot:Hpha_TRINITY_DN15710_c4_g1::TRINITY_DN15710_c4_g1_i2::g.41696::m.41696/K08867/WNK, PRKWNK; WNK lysine deficient protein kinase